MKFKKVLFFIRESFRKKLVRFLRHPLPIKICIASSSTTFLYFSWHTLKSPGIARLYMDFNTYLKWRGEVRILGESIFSYDHAAIMFWVIIFSFTLGFFLDFLGRFNRLLTWTLACSIIFFLASRTIDTTLFILQPSLHHNWIWFFTILSNLFCGSWIAQMMNKRPNLGPLAFTLILSLEYIYLSPLFPPIYLFPISIIISLIVDMLRGRWDGFRFYLSKLWKWLKLLSK